MACVYREYTYVFIYSSKRNIITLFKYILADCNEFSNNYLLSCYQCISLDFSSYLIFVALFSIMSFERSQFLHTMFISLEKFSESLL